MASSHKKDDWQNYFRLLGYVKPYKWRLIGGLFFGALYGASTGGLLSGLKEFTGSAFNADYKISSSVEKFNHVVHDALFQGLHTAVDKSWVIAISLSLLFILLAFLRGLADYLSTYFMEWVGNRVVMSLRDRIFSHLQNLSLSYYTASRTGELMSRTINDTTLVEKSVTTVLGDLAKQPFVLVAAIFALVQMDARLALISLLLFPVCIVPVVFLGRKVRNFTKQGQEKIADLSSVLQEAIAGARVIKAFGMEHYEIQRFNNYCRSVFNRAIRVTRAKAAVEPIIVLVSAIGLSLVFFYIKWSGMTVEQFIGFSATLVVMYEPVKKLSKIHIQIQQSSSAADRIFELLDTNITVQEKIDAQTFSGPVRDIVFENVSFAYGTTPILKDINLRVAAGECIALVGSSGSGKSTMVSLLPRFYDVTDGRMLINGIDVRDMTIKSLRSQSGIVTQETFLFNDTVANNIAYGHAEAARSKIEDAARRALAHDFIMQMPHGYDTVIGERGVRLSGGQCQRLAIARAILRNPPILILDEATSALDTESERQVQAALNELMSGRTVFAIAHRLSTVTHADRILVLDKGQIVEQGNHKELLDRGGLYKYFYELQFSEKARSVQIV